MVRQVQSLIKFSSGILLLGVALGFYQTKRFTVNCCNVPAVYTLVSEDEIRTSGGITYRNDTPYSGWYYRLYPGGDTAFIKGYCNGWQEGRALQMYENGVMAEIRWYHNGRQEGFQQGWFENGNRRFEAYMKDDHYEGNVKEWFRDGTLFRDFNYVNGQEDGMQKMYWNNGKIRANYQVVNGRKYGLTGVKNCVTVWSDSSNT